MKFDNTFDSTRLICERAKAARGLLECGGTLETRQNDLIGLDKVLDFLDAVGFYVHGQQISPEIAHQHFHYWIRGYFEAARLYIDLKHKTEKTVWEYVRELYELTSEVEAQRNNGRKTKRLSPEDIKDFLRYEMGPAMIIAEGVGGQHEALIVETGALIEGN